MVQQVTLCQNIDASKNQSNIKAAMAYDLEKVNYGSVKCFKNTDTIAKFGKPAADFAAKTMIPLLIVER